MTEKWFAKRQSVTARTDEDAAMASKTEGPFVDRYEARAALITLIEREIAGWKRMGMDASRAERALVRVVEDNEDDVTEGNVRWHIVNVGQPVAPVKSRPLSATMSLTLVGLAMNDENAIFATKTGTWAALVTRGLVTPGSRPTDHQLTDAGRVEAARLAPLTDPAEQAAALLRIAEGNAELVLESLDRLIAEAHGLGNGANEAYHQATRTELYRLTQSADQVTIPAVSDAQREASYYAARRTVDLVIADLSGGMSAELTEGALRRAAERLNAAAGHLAIAENDSR